MTEDSRINEIRAVLEGEDWHGAVDADTIRAILDAASPGPRVFFPGDTVPAYTSVQDPLGAVHGLVVGWVVPSHPEYSPALMEVFLPSPEQWHAVVSRAMAERSGDHG